MRWDTFDIPQGVEEQDDFDYVTLGRHVEVLGYVLMNVAHFVRRERRERKADSDITNKSLVADIERLIERLGGRIGECS